MTGSKGLEALSVPINKVNSRFHASSLLESIAFTRCWDVMSSVQRQLQLRDGSLMPAIGLGTWKSESNLVGQAVDAALEVGYRHLDCASIYGNEREIGEATAQACRQHAIPRDELWITSKLWNDCHEPEHVRPALIRTLEDLQLDFLDLYLIHWPVSHHHGIAVAQQASEQIARNDLSLADTWQAMEALVDEGLVGAIGVSNFSELKLSALMQDARILPSVNQVERHPYLQQPSLLSFCHQHKIVLTAYSPLGSGGHGSTNLLHDPVIQAIGADHDCSPAQVLLAWGLAQDTVVIPKSVKPERLQSNLDAAFIKLREEDLAKIKQLDRNLRFNGGEIWILEGGDYTIANLWDAS